MFIYICMHVYIKILFVSSFSHVLLRIGSRFKGEDSNDAKGRWIGRGKRGKVGSVGVLFVGAKASQA